MKTATDKRAQSLGAESNQRPITPRALYQAALNYFGFKHPQFDKDWIMSLAAFTFVVTLYINFSYLITANPLFAATYKMLGLGAWIAVYGLVSWIIWSIKTHIPLHYSAAALVGFVVSSLPLLAILKDNGGGTWGNELLNMLTLMGLPISSVTLLYASIFVGCSIYLGNPIFKVTQLIKKLLHPLTAKDKVLQSAENRSIENLLNSSINPEKINTANNQSAVTKLFTAYGLANTQSIKIIAGDVINREIIKLPIGSNINLLEKNIKNIKRDFGKPLVINSFVEDYPSCIAVDVPSANRKIVKYQALYDSPEFQKSTAHIPLILGVNTQRNIIIKDLAEMPHGLIAGASGGGKTSAAHSIICALASRFDPQYIQFQLIDLKRLDMTFYDDLPHLYGKTAYTFESARRVAESVVMELEHRKQLISAAKCIDIIHYNQKHPNKPLPFLVFITDEMASIFSSQKMEDPDDEKKTKTRRNIILPDMNTISQQARAFGVHMLMMTQQPSKTAIPSDIQANIGQRVCLTTSTEEESKFILGKGNPNAAYLLKKGDGFLYNADTNEYERIHMPFLNAKNGDLERTIKQIKQKWA